MRKFLRVALYEYTNGVFRWGFLLSLLAPLLAMLFMSLVLLIAFLPEINLEPVGYVDLSGVLAEAGERSDQEVGLIPLLHFESEAQARAAIEAGEIQAYYVLEADYEQSNQARLVARNKANLLAHGIFTQFVRARLLASQPEQIAERVRYGSSLSVSALDGSRQTGPTGIGSIYLPGIASLGLLLIGFSSSGYLTTAIMEERLNRSLEILLTSVSSWQLVGGKAVGLLSVGMTPLLFWFSPILALFALRPAALLGLVAQFTPPGSLGIMLATFTLTLIMSAGLMMAIGAVSADYRDAQIITSLLFLPLYAPMFLMTMIPKNPDSPLATALSFFPLMSPIIVSMRVAVASIPFSQAAAIVAVQAWFALCAIWLADRAWRIGLWNPNWRISFKRIFSQRKGADRNGARQHRLPWRRWLRRSRPGEDSQP